MVMKEGSSGKRENKKRRGRKRGREREGERTVSTLTENCAIFSVLFIFVVLQLIRSCRTNEKSVVFLQKTVMFALLQLLFDIVKYPDISTVNK